MTLSFHKVQFDAQEILDAITDLEWETNDKATLDDFRTRFTDLADERSRQ